MGGKGTHGKFRALKKVRRNNRKENNHLLLDPNSHTPSHDQSKSANGSKAMTRNDTLPTRFFPATSTSYWDGSWLYIKLPMELRQEPLAHRVVTEAVLATGKVEPSDIQTLYPHTTKGWAVRCTNSKAVQALAGEVLVLQEYSVPISKYPTGDATVFVSDHTNNADPWDMGREIISFLTAQVAGHSSFWLGLQEYRGIRGSHAVIVFSQPPGLDQIYIEIKSRIENTVKPFHVRFRAVNPVDETCYICGGSHCLSVELCLDIQPMLMAKHENSEGLQLSRIMLGDISNRSDILT